MNDTRDVTLSKALSRILRHSARKENLQINEEGFIKVSDILENRHFKGKYTVEDIKQVVLNNNKQRFTLRTVDSKVEICANQGHSITGLSKLNLLEITSPPDFDVVHGTYVSSWQKIKDEGLSRMKRNHIHFAKGLPAKGLDISGVRKNCQVFIYINVPLALSEGIKFYKSINEVILSPGNQRGIIEPKYFLKVHFQDQKV